MRICYSAYEAKFYPTFYELLWKDHLKYIIIFVTPFLVEIFNFIGYPNNATTDVILYKGRNTRGDKSLQHVAATNFIL